MPFSLVASGSKIQIIFSDGTIQDVTLPSGVSVVASQPARFAVLGRNVIVANAVSQPIWVDPDGNARPVVIVGPALAPTLAVGAAGGLSGDFAAAFSYTIKDDFGNLLFETPRSPVSNTLTATADIIDVSAISISGTAAINGRRVYRSADGPTDELFFWFDLDDNTTTTFSDDTSDEALSVEAAPSEVGVGPLRMEIVTEWKGRLWAKNAIDPENLIYTALNKLYAWPAENELIVQPVGRDRFGITGLIKRRDELGVCRRDILWKIVGSNEDDFSMVKVVEGKGCVSHETIVVVRDVARFLGDDGVFEWDDSGFRSITDETVHPWFTTDTYFNRALFPSAFARYDPFRNAYDLFLAATGSTVFDRWITFDIDRKKWMGPHKTDAFTPCSAGLVYDSSELLVPVIGGTDNYVYKVTPGTYRDGASTTIDFDVTGKFHSSAAPDIHHYWGELSILTRIESAGTLSIFPKVGRLADSAGATISHDLTLGRQRLRRLGVGPLLNLRFRNNENNQRVELYGYEVAPVFEYGRR